MQAISVVLIDHDTGTDAALMSTVAAALTTQAQRDFAPIWNINASVRYDTTVKAGDWAIYLLKDPDQPGALGDHDETPEGLPLGRGFPLLDAQDGQDWSITVSHELLEMLGDPYLTRAAQMPSGKFIAYESCDAVEEDVYEIDVGSQKVKVSNFCTPQWFEPPHKRAGVKYDFLGKLRRPFTMTRGGYMQIFDPQQGWQMITAPSTPRSQANRLSRKLDLRSLSRVARRQRKQAVGI